MKRLLVLLGVALGLTTGSLQAQTANNSKRPTHVVQGAEKARQDAAIARAVKNHRCVYYITSYTVTGSSIPQVVTRYEGTNTTANAFTTGRAFGSRDLGLTGSLNVGAALYALDPAISIR